MYKCGYVLHGSDDGHSKELSQCEHNTIASHD